jgi:hypothetical protein
MTPSALPIFIYLDVARAREDARIFHAATGIRFADNPVYRLFKKISETRRAIQNAKRIALRAKGETFALRA